MSAEYDEDKLIEEILSNIKLDELEWSHTVQVGDYVDCDEDKFFLSGPQYMTKDKLYQVKQLDMREHCKTVIVDADIGGEIAWLGIRRIIVRNGEIIWRCRTQRAIIELLKTKSPAELDEYELKLFEPDLTDLK